MSSSFFSPSVSHLSSASFIIPSCSAIFALKPEAFSSPLLGKVYGQLQSRYGTGLEISLAVLEDLTHEEMSHVAGIAQRSQGPVNETALQDCIKTIRAEHQVSGVSSDDDILAWQAKLKESKGTRA